MQPPDYQARSFKNYLERAISRGQAGKAGFTLVEIMVSVALLGIAAGSSLWALSQSNQFAALSRLNTGAQIAAQNEIDLLVSTGPFNPQRGQFGAARTKPEFAPDGSAVVMPFPLAVGRTPIRDIKLYEEPPVSGVAAREIHGTIVTTVVAQPITVKGRSLNAHSATVTVNYVYRGKAHSVELYTLRSSDVDGVS